MVIRAPWCKKARTRPANTRPACCRTFLRGAHPRHLVHGGLQREQLLLPRVLAEHAREGAVGPRMWLARAIALPRVERDRVGADHEQGMREHLGHVLDALREADHPDRALFLEEEIHEGLGGGPSR